MNEDGDLFTEKFMKCIQLSYRQKMSFTHLQIARAFKNIGLTCLHRRSSQTNLLHESITAFTTAMDVMDLVMGREHALSSHIHEGLGRAYSKMAHFLMDTELALIKEALIKEYLAQARCCFVNAIRIASEKLSKDHLWVGKHLQAMAIRIKIIDYKLLN